MANKRITTGSIGLVIMQMRTVIALLILSILFTILLASKGINFLEPASLIMMAKHVAKTALIGLGMTFVIITGGIDLSVGSVVGICGMIAGGLIRVGLPLDMFGVTLYPNVAVIVLICLSSGILIGALNGLIITRFNVPAFIATLGTMYIVRGFANIMSNGATFPDLQGKEELGNTGFTFIGQGSFLAIPISVWLMVLFFAVTLYVSRKTPLGRHIYAIGGNKRASELSGIRVNRTTGIVYLFSGLCAAVVGLILSSELVASHPRNGEFLEMNAIAAAVLGGTSMSGGIGTVGGTIIGAFVIGVLSDGLVMYGVSEFWQIVFKGLVIILAVIFDQMNQKMNARAVVQADKKRK
jgi:ribose/xylose/arabinose/galactoside ABC-type transport system permease subunit